jgi:(1->4)-alpha-D-glucan 1-alpha-D-glucosylmutase
VRIPVATYRLQLDRNLGFQHVRALIPYLHALGISDLYLSPILEARPGSPHGYDVTDPCRLNPELGTDADFDALTRELHTRGMGLLLDIVPNHMAAHPANPWWHDLLEHGPSSPYASFFDIDWRPSRGGLPNKVVLPVLGHPYGQTLENGELTLAFQNGSFFIQYYDARLPLDPRSYPAILTHRLKILARTTGADHPGFKALIDLTAAFQRLPARTTSDPVKRAERRDAAQALRQRLWTLYVEHPEIRSFIDENVRIFNGRTGDPASFALLDRILTDQAYWLAFWKTASQQVNYRRFFAINDLVGVRVEDPGVFEDTHALILRLVRERKVTGLRIDHLDGLYDPAAYLRRLRGRIAGSAAETPGFFVIVEKILSGDETLPEDWPIAGTTGYDFLGLVNGLLVDPRGLQALDSAYARHLGRRQRFADVAYENKKRVIEQLFAGEIAPLQEQLSRLAKHDRHARDLPAPLLAQALVEVTACLPVYRTYVSRAGVSPRDRLHIEHAIHEAKRRNPLSAVAFDFLQRVLLLGSPGRPPGVRKDAWRRFTMRWQQLTGPVMAKGVEDTAFYVYNRLISLNEVGCDPGNGSLSVDEFHRRCLGRQERWPATLNATATHDTKRGEDVRARIHVLSEMPTAWASHLNHWRRTNHPKKRTVAGLPVPDPAEEILLYQTLLGTWPLDEDELPSFRERLRQYLVKAAREASVHTNWVSPDLDYEAALVAFVDDILEPDDPNRNEFLLDFLQFQKTIAFHGALNSLAQLLLKTTAPGIPDFYQGTELWDFRMVDPDNRQPVDFDSRARLLSSLASLPVRPATVAELLAHWPDGRIKLYVTARVLAFRRAHPDLFARGAYLPLACSGRKRNAVVAFARHTPGDWAVTVVPRHTARLTTAGRLPLGESVWATTSLVLPPDAPTRWVNVLTGEELRALGSGRKRTLRLAAIFAHAPIALLHANP